MRFLFALVLLTLFAVVSQGSSERAVPVIKDAVDPLAFRQVTSAPSNVVGVTPAPVPSLERGLPFVRKASRQPILAMSESRGWFFYATAVARDGHGRPEFFIEGYAIPRGGRQVISWGVW